MEVFVDRYDILKQLDEKFKTEIKLFCIFAYNEALFVTKNDKIYCLGSTQSGRLGLSPNKLIEKPTLLQKLCDKKIINFFYGDNYVLSRTENRDFYCWGFNRFGQLGNEDFNHEFIEPKINTNLSELNVIDVCCGSSHSLTLTESGEVYAWGWNGWGELGLNNNTNQSKPLKVVNFESEKIIAISCGSDHSMALSESGNVFSWGRNSSGQLGFDGLLNEKIEQLNAPKLVRVERMDKMDIKFNKISCGQSHSLLLTSDGHIYAFGSNSCGQIGNNSNEDQYIAVKLDIQTKFIDIASHPKYNISVGLSSDFVYYVWGMCGKEIIKTPKKSGFKSFNDIFGQYFQITYKSIHL